MFDITIEPTAKMLTWAKRSALYRLSKRDHTRHELRTAIIRKATEKFAPVSPECVHSLGDYAVAFCDGLRLLNDGDLAHRRARAASLGGRSTAFIRQKLRGQGVNAEYINNAISELDDLQAALAFCRKRRLGQHRETEPRQDKEYRILMRAGFSFDIAKRALTIATNDLNDDLD